MMARIAKAGVAVLFAALLVGCAAAVPPVLLDAENPIFAALRAGDTTTLQALLAGGEDVQARDLQGNTPLHHAAERDDTGAGRLLLSAGAQVSAPGEHGFTPLHAAAWKGKAAFAELLLGGGADIDAVESAGRTPLHVAAAVKSSDVVRLLLKNGAAINAAGAEGQTPLHLAAGAGHADVVEVLVARGAELNREDAFGRTPLLLAVRHGHADAAKALLVRGADATISADDGSSPPAYPAYAAALFDMNAPQYRRLARSELPLDARRHKVRAELAVREKRFQDALQEYRELLTLAPWHAETHFNNALVLAVQSEFPAAIRSMKSYLQLVPDAPNARLAQDKIFEWEARAGM